MAEKKQPWTGSDISKFFSQKANDESWVFLFLSGWICTCKERKTASEEEKKAHVLKKIAYISSGWKNSCYGCKCRLKDPNCHSLQKTFNSPDQSNEITLQHFFLAQQARLQQSATAVVPSYLVYLYISLGMPSFFCALWKTAYKFAIIVERVRYFWTKICEAWFKQSKIFTQPGLQPGP